MRTILTALMLTVATQAGAECSKLCDEDWWKTATEAEVQAELDGGADVMARDKYGDTPLHWAASWGTSENIQILLDAGADLMAMSNYGGTPLHLAAKYGSPANIQALLAAGADVMARTKDGAGRRCTLLVGLMPLQTPKHCWPLEQTSWRELRMGLDAAAPCCFEWHPRKYPSVARRWSRRQGAD